jgi:hypothetical protein
MKDIPKHILVTIILLVVVTLLGGGAWYWSSGQLKARLEEKAGLESQVQTVEKKGIYPSSQNKKTLEEQKKQLEELELKVRPNLQAQMELFTSLEGMVPDGWKKAFDQKRQALRALSKSKNLILPDDYNFAFKSYVLAAPRAEFARDLGVQLFTIEELVKIVADSELHSLVSVKRVMIEQAAIATTSSSSAPVSDEAVSNAKILTDPEGVYRVIPYELTLKGDPSAILRFINGLGNSRFFFVTRFIYLENEKSSVLKRSEITTPTEGEAEVKKTLKTLVTVVGQEKVTARIRLDHIDFLPPAKVEEKKAAAPKKQGGTQ